MLKGCRSHVNLCAILYARTTRSLRWPLIFCRGRSLPGIASKTINKCDERGENDPLGTELVSMSYDPRVNKRENEQISRYVQTRNLAFEPAIVCSRRGGRLWHPNRRENSQFEEPNWSLIRRERVRKSRIRFRILDLLLHEREHSKQPEMIFQLLHGRRTVRATMVKAASAQGGGRLGPGLGMLSILLRVGGSSVPVLG